MTDFFWVLFFCNFAAVWNWMILKYWKRIFISKLIIWNYYIFMFELRNKFFNFAWFLNFRWKFKKLKGNQEVFWYVFDNLSTDLNFMNFRNSGVILSITQNTQWNNTGNNTENIRGFDFYCMMLNYFLFWHVIIELLIKNRV